MTPIYPFVWNKAPSFSEGVQTLYVDTRFGVNGAGRGTRTAPLRTIESAWSLEDGRTSYPKQIIWRGISHANLVGDHSCIIEGDMYGEAIYDGEGLYQLAWFGGIRDVIYLNGGNEFVNMKGTASNISSLSGSFAAVSGCGRAGGANGVGVANLVYGFAASPVLCVNSKLWRGCIGGIGASNMIYSKIQPCSPSCKVSIGSYNGTPIKNCTIHGVKIANRNNRSSQMQMAAVVEGSIFADFDFFISDSYTDTFTRCLFLADCDFYFTKSNVQYKVVIGNSTASTKSCTLDATNHKCVVDGVSDMGAAIEEVYDSGTLGTRRMVFNNCKFSTQTTEQVFNDAKNYDFTLKLDCDAVEGDVYYGALPPALHIGCYDAFDSDGHLNCWDGRTATGCISVNEEGVFIDTTSGATSGSVLSKIIRAKQQEIQYNGFFAIHEMQQAKGICINDPSKTCFGTKYDAGDTLPVGSYIAMGNIVYDGVSYSTGDYVEVETTGTTFSEFVSGEYGALFVMRDPNIKDVIFVRCRSMIYNSAKVGAGVGLHAKVCYLNYGNKPISFHGRTVVAGESFECCHEGDVFSAVSGDTLPADYTIAAMFDDRELANEADRIVPAAEFVPAKMFAADYFVSKTNGVIDKTEDGVPESSGNYRAWKSGGNYTHNISGAESIINQPFIQLAIMAQYIGD